jgi:septal ring factor EnvC (AmiA/AmiB activator)
MKGQYDGSAKVTGRAILLICLVVLLSPPALPLGAESPRDEYRQIQRDLRKEKKKLESVKREERSAVDTLKKAEEEHQRILEQLNAKRGSIAQIQKNMNALQSEINSLKNALREQGDLLRKRLRTLQRTSRETDPLLIVLGGEDISRSLRIVRYLKDISARDYALMNRYAQSVRNLQERQDRLAKLHGDLKKEERELGKLEDSLEHKKKEKQQLLVAVKKEKAAHENMIRELRESSAKLQRIIQESERKEQEQKRKKKGEKPKPGVKEEPEEESAFSRMKGKLPWPASGSIAMRYGSQVDPLFNLPIFRSGIHISTPKGSQVKSVFEGKVVYAEEFKGYGQLVIVSHGGGYHTLYGNLSRIFLRNGAIIKNNQTVGESGDSGAAGALGLYFEVRYRGKPLDPQQWLKR